MKLRVLVSAFLLATAGFVAPASAKSYSADRFDSTIRVLPDGTLDVTETVVFRFDDGTFREVYREIPKRRTDGIEIVRATMQGRTLPFGKEAGTVEVAERSSRVRVVWRFSPIEDATREFVLNYRVSGVVRHEAGADLLAWRATPGEHRYRIASSTIRFELPVAPLEPPVLTTRKTESSRLALDDNVVRVTATDLRENGWVEAAIKFPARSVAAAAPAWQQRTARANERAGTWIIAAVAIAGIGLILLFAWRQGYEAPPSHAELGGGEWHQPGPPDSMPVPIGGVLAANGGTTLEHAMATMFALAARGELDIRERSRGMLSQRDFDLSRRGTSTLTSYERTALQLAFGTEDEPTGTVKLSQARARLTRRLRKFSAAMNAELASLGLLDAGRRSVRRRYNRAGAMLLVVAGLAAVPAALLGDEYGPWPLLIPAAVALVALASLIFGSATTPLSNEGVRRAHLWRQYRKHLEGVARGKRSAAGLAPDAVLPIAIAFGLASAWSKFLKTHKHPAPAWFHTLPGHDHAAFPAFIAAGGAGAHGTGGGAGGGGAAGGGGSGAG